MSVEKSILAPFDSETGCVVFLKLPGKNLSAIREASFTIASVLRYACVYAASASFRKK
jgi:hypothetical protein